MSVHFFSSQRFKYIGLFFAGIGAGIIGYALVLHVQEGRQPVAQQLRAGTAPHHLINPLLACNNAPENYGNNRYTVLEEKLATLVSDEKKAKHATDISIYYHEFPSGRWVGIDEQRAYDPASLLKIVLMITYLKQSEGHPDLLTQTLTYSDVQEETNGKVAFAATTSLSLQAAYTIENLLYRMIAESDNGATALLLNHVDQTLLAQVYKELGIPSPETVSGNYTISPVAYSLFFRILYNATYLNRELSEKAMSILTQTTYADGLTLGVPNGTVVAHKFGEHINGNTSGNIASVELHDCGIVYGPITPYFLCVMTNGTSVGDLSGVIHHISETVYQSVNTSE